jgi:hypothetical protein
MNRRSFIMASAGVLGSLPFYASGSRRKPAPTMLEKHPKGWIDVSPGPELQGWTEYKWFGVFGDDWRNAKQWHMNPDSGILLCDGLQPLSKYHSMILMDREWKDFIFHVEWKFTHLDQPTGYSGYNSGVFVRMKEETPDVKVMHQVETGSVLGHAGWLRGGTFDHGVLTVLDTHVWVDDEWRRVDPGFPGSWKPLVKSITPESDPKGLKSAYDVGIEGPVHPAGEWNTYEVTCQDSKISVQTNGVPSSYADNCQVPVGRIGLECEGHRIEFRNLRVKPLS